MPQSWSTDNLDVALRLLPTQPSNLLRRDAIFGVQTWDTSVKGLLGSFRTMIRIRVASVPVYKCCRQNYLRHYHQKSNSPASTHIQEGRSPKPICQPDVRADFKLLLICTRLAHKLEHALLGIYLKGRVLCRLWKYYQALGNEADII